MALNFFKIGKGLSLAPQSSIPGAPSNGDIIFDSNTSSFMLYQGGAWTTFSAKTDVASAASLSSAEFTSAVVRNSVIRITGSTVGDIHGLTAAGSAKTLIIYNASSVTMTIKNQSVTEGSAANRIITPDGTDTTLEAGYSATLMYDDTQSRWIYVAPFAPGGGGGGGGGGNIFSGNTNLSGTYYGDVIVYGGNATVTGNLTVHGNLITDGQLNCTGDFSIDIKNDLYVGKSMDYSPATGGKDITVGGNMTVIGESITSNTTFGPFDIINVTPYPGSFGFVEVTTSGYPSIPGTFTFDLTAASPNYPYSDVCQATMIDYYAPGTTTLFLTGPASPFNTTDTWEYTASVTTHNDIVIAQKADKSLIVQGDLKCRKLTGNSVSPATKSLSLFVGGNLLYSDSFIGFVVNPEILLNGTTESGLSGGDIEVKGCVYDHSITTSGSTITSGNIIPGNSGFVRIGGYNAPNASIYANGGSSSNNTIVVSGGNSGGVWIGGQAICSAIEASGGNTYGSGGGDGGFAGTVEIRGDAINSYIVNSGGTATVLGNGRSGGTISLQGSSIGQRSSNGGNGTGSGKFGGNGGTISITGPHRGSLASVGASGTSAASGGSGGYIYLYGYFSLNLNGTPINCYGGNGNGVGAGGHGGTLLLYGGGNCNNISCYGGASSGSGTGGRGGIISAYGPIVANIINAYGGNSATGTAGYSQGVTFAAGVQCSDLYMHDGTGIAPTGTVTAYLGGTCIFGSISIPNRTQSQIRAFGSYIATATLRVRALPIKDILYNSSGLNPTAAQAALCASRLYIYNSAATVWQYSAFTNA